MTALADRAIPDGALEPSGLFLSNGSHGLGIRVVLAHLTDGRTSVVLAGDGGMPEILHWGAALGMGDLDVTIFERPVVGGSLDLDAPIGLVPEARRGWFGPPGIEGCRPDGTDFAPRFRLESSDVREGRFVAQLRDLQAGLELTLHVELDDTGMLVVRAELTNTGASPFRVDALRLALPVPAHADELLTLTGRHNFEFVPQRTPWRQTCLTVENRHGKTSHERVGAVFAGPTGFGEHAGEVWGAHIGWSGDYELRCDAVTDARRVIHVGERLSPGEVVLATGETYATPLVYAAYSANGLNRVSRTFHDHLRARRAGRRRPQPVLLNTWEALYFDHDPATVRALADAAAAVGIERFVLDDGWFGSRRDDRRGLGDWSVSAEVWPDGLGATIEHVRSLGMEFGIWVEPEMVNPDSDLYRVHPDWALVDRRYPPVTGRHQLVLDIGRADVREHIFVQLDALLRAHDITYVKWDHNCDLVAPTSHGRAGTRGQTLGFYALVDRLRAAHPSVEFETCASGGGRVDFGVLMRTDRAWTSDSIDALDRHRIQRGFSLLFPPDIMGAHIGAGVTHTTKRRHRVGFRAVSALFGAFGVECNLLESTPEEQARISEAIAIHKRFRPLLHSGDVFRGDHPDPTIDVYGVVAKDCREALVSVTRLASGPTHHIAPIRIPDLRPAAHYRVTSIAIDGEPTGDARRQPSWLTTGFTATGQVLGRLGISCPALFPETSLLLHITEVDGGES